MTYYMFLPGDDQRTAGYFETNLLGETSFKNFWVGSAWYALKRVIDKPHIAHQVTIKSSSGKSFTIDEFLDELKGLKIIEER